LTKKKRDRKKERNQRAKPQKAISMHSQQHKVNFQHEPLKENTQEKIYTKKKTKNPGPKSGCQ